MRDSVRIGPEIAVSSSLYDRDTLVQALSRVGPYRRVRQMDGGGDGMKTNHPQLDRADNAPAPSFGTEDQRRLTSAATHDEISRRGGLLSPSLPKKEAGPPITSASSGKKEPCKNVGSLPDKLSVPFLIIFSKKRLTASRVLCIIRHSRCLI